MQPAFTIKEAVSYGWKRTLEHLGFMAVLTLSLFVITAILNKLGHGPAFGLLYKVVNIAVSYFAMFTFVRVGLQIHRGEKPLAKNIFEFSWETFGFYVIASLITMVITGIGYALLIIPGIYLTIRLAFYSFALVEGNLKPTDALGESWNLTRRRFWPLFGFTIIIFLINLAGVIAFGIGLLVTAPLCLFASIYVYDKLKAAQSLVALKKEEISVS